MSSEQLELFMTTLHSKICAPVYMDNVRKLKADLEAICAKYTFVPRQKLVECVTEDVNNFIEDWFYEREIPPWIQARLTVDLRLSDNLIDEVMILPCPALERVIFEVIPPIFVTTWPGFEEKWDIYYEAVKLGLRMR